MSSRKGHPLEQETHCRQERILTEERASTCFDRLKSESFILIFPLGRFFFTRFTEDHLLNDGAGPLFPGTDSSICEGAELHVDSKG